MNLKLYIRDIPDFPIPGILFRDITPLLANPDAFTHVIEELKQKYIGRKIDAVVAIDARGFIFGAPLAISLKKPLILARKSGKLPGAILKSEYALEYGTNTIEIHKDALIEGHKILIVDDLLATGGTFAATASLVENAGAKVDSMVSIIEVKDLSGRKLLQGYEVFSLVEY